MITISYANVPRKPRKYVNKKVKPYLSFGSHNIHGKFQHKLYFSTALREIIGQERYFTMYYEEDEGNAKLYIGFQPKPVKHVMKQGVYKIDRYGYSAIVSMGELLKDYICEGRYEKFVYDAEKDTLIVTIKESK